MSKQQVGVIGMGVMGRNLALNIESRGFSLAVYDINPERTASFIEGIGDKRIIGTISIEDFVKSLDQPRKIIMMITAGQPVDDAIGKLKYHVSKGDILVDCGNSHFLDTLRRSRELEAGGIHYMGVGISGGEEGALKGPAVMPGGKKEIYGLMEPVLTSIAAKACGEPCCTYIGPDGAGHYVKMVHNGIEYCDMQLIAEAYFLLKNMLGLSNNELHDTFAGWSKGELNSYLIEITGDIFAKTDAETGKPIVDVILDSAGQKGTGKWASQSALDLGAPIPTITEAVFARCMSALKPERVLASKRLKGPGESGRNTDGKIFSESVRRALYASKICAYAQGFSLLRAAAKEYGWNLNYGSIAMIFREGCIIRAGFLQKIKEAFDKNPDLANLLLDGYFKNIIESYQKEWREVIVTAVNFGIPVPAFMSALAYFDSYRAETLPANLIQAQRDYFGAHTYRRTDRDGVFHTQWTG